MLPQDKRVENSSVARSATAEVLAPPVTERVLDEIVARIVRQADPVRIVLFGSTAWGEPNEESDVDLLVIMSGDGSMWEQAAALYGVLSPCTVPVDLVVRTSAQIAERLELGDPFVREIIERGRTVYERQPVAARR